MVVKISEKSVALKNNFRKIEKNKILILLVFAYVPETMFPWFRGVKSALLYKSAEQGMKALWTCGAILPCKFMEQGRLCPAILESNANIAPKIMGI